jgi:AcrR family transcriptional regulator
MVAKVMVVATVAFADTGMTMVISPMASPSTVPGLVIWIPGGPSQPTVVMGTTLIVYFSMGLFETDAFVRRGWPAVRSIQEPQNVRSRGTRDALLDATRQIIEADGYDKLTMAGVAARAGVTRRAVYLHFASRAELVSALYEYLGDAEGLRESLSRVWASPDASAALDEWANHIARTHPRILSVARAHDRFRRTDPDAGRYWQQVMGGWLKGCRRLMSWLDGEGHLAPPWTVNAAADMMYGLMSFDLLERMLEDRQWSRKRYGESLALLFRATFTGGTEDVQSG